MLPCLSQQRNLKENRAEQTQTKKRKRKIKKRSAISRPADVQPDHHFTELHISALPQTLHEMWNTTSRAKMSVWFRCGQLWFTPSTSLKHLQPQNVKLLEDHRINEAGGRPRRSLVQPWCFTVEGNQVGQACPPLGQPVLAAPSDLLLPVLASVPREELWLDAKAVENSDIRRCSHSAAPATTKVLCFRGSC